MDLDPGVPTGTSASEAFFIGEMRLNKSFLSTIVRIRKGHLHDSTELSAIKMRVLSAVWLPAH
jgi:hypothetical protein